MSNQKAVREFLAYFIDIEVRETIDYLKENNKQEYTMLKENVSEENISGTLSDIDYMTYGAVDFIMEDIENYQVYADCKDLNEVIKWGTDVVIESIIKQFYNIK